MKSLFLVLVVVTLLAMSVEGRPKEGPPNTRWSKCGSSCPVTCDNRLLASPHCSQVCVPGYVCYNGYLWNSKKTACVTLFDCKINAGKKVP